MEIRYTAKFERMFRRLPAPVKKLARKKIEIFRHNQHAPSLRTHKLTGELLGKQSFSVNYQYRIVFEYDGEIVVLLMIGTHEIYD